jgi:hypothetical protein
MDGIELKSKVKKFMSKLREGVSSSAKFISLVGSGANNQTVELKNSSTTNVVAYIIDKTKIPTGVTVDSFAQERGIVDYTVQSLGENKVVIASIEAMGNYDDLTTLSNDSVSSLFAIGDQDKSFAVAVVMVTEVEESEEDTQPITIIQEEDSILMNAQEPVVPATEVAVAEVTTAPETAEVTPVAEAVAEVAVTEAPVEELQNKGSMAELTDTDYGVTVMKAFEAQLAQAIMSATKQTTDAMAVLEGKVATTLGTVESVLKEINARFATTQELQNSAEEINTQLKNQLSEATAISEALTASSVTVTRTSGQAQSRRSVYDIA